MKFVQSPYHSSREGNKIDGIVVHTTVGGYESTITYFQKNDRKVSSHYVVSLDGDITQMVDEELASHHAGIVRNPTTSLYKGINPNLHTIGIEDADNKNPHEADRSKQLPALAKLVREICDRHDIPIDRKHIVGHKEIRSDKTCPGNINVDEVVRLAKGDTIGDMDSYKENAIKLLDDYRNKRTTDNGAEGNYESYVVSIIANDKRYPKEVEAKVTLESKNSALESILATKEKAIESMKDQIQTLTDALNNVEDPKIIVKVIEPNYKDPVARFFNKLAKFAEGGVNDQS